MAELPDWFTSIPYFTKRWLALTVILTLAGRFGILNPFNFMLFYEPFIKKFEVSY
jgi:Derlin-1